MAQKRDYYEILEISKSATSDEIKRAYRKLAKKYHPDLNKDNPGAEMKFKEVNEAYEVLSDPTKKSRYDQFGHAGVDPNYGAAGGPQGSYYSAGGPFGGGSPFGGFDFENIFDFFSDGFGSRRTQTSNGPRDGSNIETSVTITFEEAAKGCSKKVSFTSISQCDECGGSGAKKGTNPVTCSTCGGKGQVVSSQNTFGMTFQTVRTCPKCNGSGKFVGTPCAKCSGQGRVQKYNNIEIKIPAGIADSQTLSIKNQGNSGINGGRSGDLHVYVHVRPHEIFTRKGDDIWCEVPITFTQAALGDEISVPTLDGKVICSIHEGTQNGDVFKLRGKGIPKLRGRGCGDEFVKVQIEIPRYLSLKQKELLKEFESQSQERNYQKRKNFFQKIKELFDF